MVDTSQQVQVGQQVWFVLSGGIALSNGSTQSDITQMLRYPPYATTGHRITLDVAPSLVVAAEPSSTAGNNSLVKSVNALTTTENAVALRVSTMGKPLTYASPSTASITTTASILAANTARRAAYISNTSASDTLYLAFGGAATAGSGIAIGPGQTFEMTEAAGNLSTQEIRGVSGGAAITVGVQEAT